MNEVPPTEHLLRPHHVGLLTLFSLTFKHFETRPLPSPFLLHIYRMLLNEVSEVTQPKTHQQLYFEMQSAPKADEQEPSNFLNSFGGVHNSLIGVEQLTNFFGSLQDLFVEKTDAEPPILARHSIFGYFCRRCYVTFLKLSFSGLVNLHQNYMAWCQGYHVGYEPIVKDELHDADLYIFKTQGDHRPWAQAGTYEEWEKALVTGDDSIAAESLRRFFEQHFHDANDSGIRQNALLNLVRMHYVREEYTAARKLLSEAINTARVCADKLTLQHCISLLHRLPPESGHTRPSLNEIQPNLNPLEVLYDVKKLMDERNEQPLSASFAKIIQAVGLYDHWADSQLGPPSDADQWAQHAVQAIIWSAAGCDQLACIEQNVVMAFTEVGGEDNNRLTTILNRAYMRAHRGDYQPGLAMLLDPSVWRGLVFSDYVLWAQEVWHILALRSTRRGQDRVYNEFLLPRRPSGDYNPRHYLLKTPSSKIKTTSKIWDSLYEVIQMRECGQAANAIDQLLTALWHSEFLFRLSHYRTAIILLADVGLEFGMSKRCRKILEEILPQIDPIYCPEQHALAAFTLARCIIASTDSSAQELREAIPYLITAERLYTLLEISSSLTDVLYLLSVVYHNTGLVKERDETSQRYETAADTARELAAVAVDDEAQEILEVVALAGAQLALR